MRAPSFPKPWISLCPGALPESSSNRLSPPACRSALPRNEPPSPHGRRVLGRLGAQVASQPRVNALCAIPHEGVEMLADRMKRPIFRHCLNRLSGDLDGYKNAGVLKPVRDETVLVISPLKTSCGPVPWRWFQIGRAS